MIKSYYQDLPLRLCIRIESINYCADSKKIIILKKFLNNNIKDIYDKTEENLQRLGFKKRNYSFDNN